MIQLSPGSPPRNPREPLVSVPVSVKHTQHRGHHFTRVHVCNRRRLARPQRVQSLPLVPEHFRHPQGKPAPTSSHFPAPPPAPSNHQSASCRWACLC